MLQSDDQKNPMIPAFGDNTSAVPDSGSIPINSSFGQPVTPDGLGSKDPQQQTEPSETYAVPSWTGYNEQAHQDTMTTNQAADQMSNEGLVPDEIQHPATGIPDTAMPPPPPSVIPIVQTTSGNPKKFPFKVVLFLIIGIILCVLTVLLIRSLLSRAPQNKEASIIYWGMWEDDVVMQSILADFRSSHPNITVQYIKNSPKQYRERIENYISQGNGPDVFRFHSTWVAELREILDYVPNTVMTPQDIASEFFPVITRDLVAGNVIFGIPIMIDGLGLYYNEDLFAAAGVTVPTTWEDVFNVVPKLTVRTQDKITTSAISLGTINNIEHWSDILALMFMQNGVNLVNPVGPDAENTLAYFRKFSDPSNPEGVYTWNDTLDNNIYAFANGRVAMILAPSWRAFDIAQINPDLRFRIVPAPQLPGHSVTWASYWVEGVSKFSKQKEAAWEFVKFLTSKETVVKLYTESSKTRLFGEPYARMDLAKTIEADPYVGAYVLQAKDARSFPLASRTFDNGLNDQIIKYLEDAYSSILTGTAPSAAMTTYAAGVKQVLSNYKLITASQSQ